MKLKDLAVPPVDKLRTGRFDKLRASSGPLERRTAVFFTAAVAAALGLLLVPAPGSAAAAQRVCLILDTKQQRITYPVAVGDTLHLSFRHSIYGSQVEEQFQVASGGFRADKLRYAELRLVEFYGHESATKEEGWWIVYNPGRELPTLDLRPSVKSPIRITFLDQTISLRSDGAVEAGVRLSVSACRGENNG
jgi:hypothetical protein